MSANPLLLTWRATMQLLMLCVTLCAANSVHALSLGDARLQSRIGEPLKVSIPLGHIGSLDRSTIVVGHAPDADYANFGSDRSSGNLLHFELLVDSNGRASVEVRTARALNEPYVDMVVQVRWPTGRLVKAYTLLLDLPPRH